MQYKKLLYFGPLTVLIEWIGIVMLLSSNSFDPNVPLSVATNADYPLPLLFGLFLTAIAISYTLFALPLKTYSEYIPKLAALAGITFILTGWIPYTGHDALTDTVHNIASYIAIGSYVLIVWFMRSHPKKPISVASKIAYKSMILGIIAAFITLYVFDAYVSLAQLYILVSIQLWTIWVVWHEMRPPKISI